MGIAYLPVQLYILPMVLQFLNGWLGLPDAELNFLFYLINFVAVAIIFHYFLGRCLSAAMRNFWESVQAVILGYVAYLVFSWALAWIFAWLGFDFENANDREIMEMAEGYLSLTVLGIVVLVPVVEECLFRGVLFGALHNKNRILAYVVSTLLFAAIHVLGYIGTYSYLTLFLCYLEYLPAGLWLAWSYEKSGNIIVPMVIHGIVNFVSFYGLR